MNREFRGLVGVITLLLFFVALFVDAAAAQDYERHKNINGAVVYDYNPETKLGEGVFGTVIADFSEPVDGEQRCSHGGPVCMEYADGTLVAFYANTSSHNIDGWSEYATSTDRGKTWDKYHPFAYSFEAYKRDPTRPMWVEEGLVTPEDVAVLFLTHFEDGVRAKNSTTRSLDNGKTWSPLEPMNDTPVGYPAAVAVSDDTSFVLMDQADGDHALYVSTDSGGTWSKRSTLPLQPDAWYGAMCLGEAGRLVAGAYVSDDEHHFYCCISEDNGRTWGEQIKAYVDKKVRDPELAYLDGKYYLHGRSGHSGEGSGRFVLYQSDDGLNWNDGVIVSSDPGHPDGYSHNCIINKYDKDSPRELMVEYSITYEPPRTSEYVFFIKPDATGE